jgi:hypothetical protein
VGVPQDNGTTLSIKATFTGFSREDLVKYTWVELQRTDKNDARKYKVTRYFDQPVEPEVSGDCDAVKSCVDSYGEPNWGQDDRVKFYLGGQYLSGSTFGLVQSILWKAFGLKPYETNSWEVTPSYSQSSYQCTGKWVICRPDQFARFLIHRDDNGIPNGFKDLKSKLVKAQPKKDCYRLVSEICGRDGKGPANASGVKRVCDALGLSKEDVDRIMIERSDEVIHVKDVSDR